MAEYLFGKPELKLALLDQIMEGNRRFQTKADWAIEKKAYDERMRTYALAAATWCLSYVFTAPSAHVKRFFGPPDLFVIPPWRMLKDACASTVLGLNGARPQATGFRRQLFCLLPSYFVLAGLTHVTEVNRYSAYLALKDKTTFGEIAGRIEDGTLSSAPVIGTLDKDTSDAIRAPDGKLQLTFL